MSESENLARVSDWPLTHTPEILIKSVAFLWVARIAIWYNGMLRW
jgi:hypothetical protein